MNNEKMGNILQMMGLVLGMSLFTVASLFFFQPLIIIFPVMFIIIGIKNGMVEGIISLMTTCTILAYIIDPIIALYLFLVFAPITITIIYTTKNRKNTMEVLLYSTVVLFASILLFFTLVNISDGNLLIQIEEMFKESLSLRLEALKEMGLTSYEIVEDMNYLENAFKQMLLIAPATLLLLTLIVSYINYSLSILGLKKVGINVVNTPKFSRFRLPNNIAVGTIVMFITVLIAKPLISEYFEAIVQNLMVLLGFMVLIQGLSIIDFFLIKIKVKTFFRFLFIFLTVIIAPLITVVSTLGLIDVIFDFRKLRRKGSL